MDRLVHLARIREDRNMNEGRILDGASRQISDALHRFDAEENVLRNSVLSLIHISARTITRRNGLPVARVRNLRVRLRHR